jgi:hypothetical protein
MCFSRRQWFEELARREREEQELRDLFDREAERREPQFVADSEPETAPAEREPVVSGR